MFLRRHKGKQAEAVSKDDHSHTDENAVPVPLSPFKKMSEQNVEYEDYVLWPSRIEETFIGLMVDEVQKNPLQTNTFHTKVWKKIEDELFNYYERRYTLQQLKSKYTRLRMKFREFVEMLGDKCASFGWDLETNTVTAAEDVWERHLRAHPNARIFHRKGLEHYELLRIIFNTTTATGSLARSFSQLPPTSNEERELEENFFRTSVHVNPVTRTQNIPLPINLTPLSSAKRASSGPQSHRPSKSNKVSSMDIALDAFIDYTKARTKKLERPSQTTEAVSNLNDRYSIAACMDTLNTLANVNDDQYAKAAKSFVDGKWCTVFMEMRGSSQMA